MYRAATEQELGQLSALAGGVGLDELAWVFTFRHGPLTLEALSGLVSQSVKETEAVVERLVAEGRVQRDGERLTAREFVIPLGSSIGWEASVFDHVQAMVQTICQRLQAADASEALPAQAIGGSTYTFDVWPGHPHYGEVKGLLAAHRASLGDLRKKVEAFNQQTRREDGFEEVVAYVGQCVRMRESGRADDHEAE